MVGGFVVVYMDKDGEDFVCFCDSLKEANEVCNAMIAKGYTAKIFKEVV
ncbi:hypothetical protein [Helicobacter rodentium]|nr:hypothetical protein [Helicobacter rodentium]